MKKLYFIITPVVLSLCIFIYACFSYQRPSADVDSNSRTNLPIIIIDPGHGGIDGGTSTADGTPEKDLNLSISLHLDEYLKLMGFKTILTRTQDVSLGEGESLSVRQMKTADIMNRMEIMKGTDNALFVSIHQNYYSVEKYAGIQVFYSRDFSDESSALAQSIQQTVVNVLQKENTRQIKECPSSVYLIHNAVKPAVLVECGFLSNTDEAKKLKTDEYRKQISFCIAMGIQNYVSTRIEE